MKLKHIVLLIFLVAIIVILYLYNKGKSPGHSVSLIAELEAKQRKLDLLLIQLSAITIEKACLDRIIAWKASLITCSLLLFCLSTSLIYNFYGPGIFPGLYMAAAWYLLALVSTLYYHKIPSWSTIMEIFTSRIMVQEYRNNNFDPGSIPVIAHKVVVLKDEIAELKEKQEAISRQNARGYHWLSVDNNAR